MRVLVLDSYGESALDFCLRCQADGHKVKWSFTETPRNACIGKGMVEVVRDWRPWIEWADLIFMPDNTKYLRELDGWRERGVKIVGPNVAGAAWELDRDVGTRVLKRAGIPVPPSREFSDYDAAIAHVKRTGGRYVSKPCGVEGDKSLTYCAKDPADMCFMLERWKQAGKLKSKFVLQEFVEGVCEMGVGGWFGPGGWNQGWELNFEHKKLMAGEIGPATGEQGTVMMFVKKSKLADRVLVPLTDQLEWIGYVGCVDVNCIITEDGTAWPLEFTMRPGWPAFNIQQALTEGDHAEWLLDLAEGRDARSWRYDTVAAGAVVALPDYPYDHRPVDQCLGVPVYGIEETHLENVHPCMMQIVDAPRVVGDKVVTAPVWASAGTYVMVVTGTGKTIVEARRKMHRILDKIHMPASPMWRNDIGLKLKKQLPLIGSLVEGMSYV